MHPIEYIRTKVFRCTQSAFAKIAGVGQGTVSRWENGEFEPSRDQLARIRDEAMRLDLAWSDEFFFKPAPPPPTEGAAA